MKKFHAFVLEFIFNEKLLNNSICYPYLRFYCCFFVFHHNFYVFPWYYKLLLILVANVVDSVNS